MAYSAIDKSSSFMSTLLYTGNGSARSLTGVGFQPDFTWIKNRAAASDQALFTSPMGATKKISSNDNSIESTIADTLTAFDSDGFSLGTDATEGIVNNNTYAYASWNWKGGTTSGISGTADITPSAYSFNQAAGFSVLKYTGNAGAIRTVLHGLGAAPELIIIKQLTTGTNAWVVGGDSIVSNWGGVLTLNTTAAIFTNAYFGGAVPDATKFSISDTSEVNSAGTYVAFCYRSIKGFSRIGKYAGNALADGPTVYTGFKPSFILTKPINYASGWSLLDNKRMGYNRENEVSVPNTNAAEGSGLQYVDFLSNGFKITSTAAEVNQSYDYLYMAFGQSLVSSTNIAATAI